MKKDRSMAQRATNKRLNEREAERLFPGFAAWKRRVLRGAALLVLVLLANCGGNVSPITVPTITQNALIAAQDIEAQLCWGVANVKASVPDRTKCTTENAKFIKLTDERHRAFNSKLAVAFDLHRDLTAQVQAGKVVDLTRLNAIITEVLDLVGQLSQTPLVVELAANVKAGGIVR